ncbi:hypothetical protein EDD37DRAFT_294801 [Exophiala viscosa]|uniref:uncharacterized protein n=1 Tax=Exophiala viscosa TaxID=2486360 RepID=UPI002194707A|nr:hypothetical protein EDD37DRAFT_294801 [Exophiala viscosa]
MNCHGVQTVGLMRLARTCIANRNEHHISGHPLGKLIAVLHVIMSCHCRAETRPGGKDNHLRHHEAATARASWSVSLVRYETCSTVLKPERLTWTEDMTWMRSVLRWMNLVMGANYVVAAKIKSTGVCMRAARCCGCCRTASALHHQLLSFTLTQPPRACFIRARYLYFLLYVRCFDLNDVDESSAATQVRSGSRDTGQLEIPNLSVQFPKISNAVIQTLLDALETPQHSKDIRVQDFEDKENEPDGASSTGETRLWRHLSGGRINKAGRSYLSLVLLPSNATSHDKETGFSAQCTPRSDMNMKPIFDAASSLKVGEFHTQLPASEQYPSNHIPYL